MRSTIVMLGALLALGFTNASFAQSVFFDDFSDGSLTNELPLDVNGNPVIWTTLPGLDQGTADASSQDLVLATTDGSGSMTLFPSQDDLTDISVRTQMRQSGASGATALFARVDVDALTAYQAGISTITGNAYIARNEPNPVTLIAESTDLDIVADDVKLQFDVVGNSLSLFVWADGGKPTDPTLMVVDDTLQSGISGVILDNSGPGSATFRFVEVVAIPEPSTGVLACLGFVAFFARRRQKLSEV